MPLIYIKRADEIGFTLKIAIFVTILKIVDLGTHWVVCEFFCVNKFRFHSVFRSPVEAPLVLRHGIICPKLPFIGDSRVIAPPLLRLSKYHHRHGQKT